MSVDPMTRLKQIERRRQLIDAMTGQNLQTPIQSGGSWGHGLAQGLAKVASAYLLNKQDQDLVGQEARARADYQTGLQGASQRFIDLLQGRKGDTMSDQQVADLMLRDQAPQLREGVKADPRQAIVEAMASQYPEMQQLGMAHLKGMGAQKPYEDSNIGNKRVRTYADGRTEVLGDFSEKWGEPFDINIDGKTVKVQRNEGSGQLRQVGTSAPQAIVNMGDKADLSYLGEVDKGISPAGELYKQARDAQTLIKNMGQAASSIERGAQSGTAEPIIQAVRGIAEQLGVKDAATAPTGELEALLSGAALTKLGELKGVATDTDLQYVLKASGSLSTNPEALKVLIALNIAKGIRDINQFEQIRQTRAAQSKNPGMFEASRVSFNQFLPQGAVGTEIADMVERILSGRSALEGAPPAVVPGQTPTAPQSPQQGPIIRNW